jgi:acetate kinase
MYSYRIKKYIGAYTAAMGGVDVIVFAGGIGENDTATRENVLSNMEFLGIHIDLEKNSSIRGKESIISTPESKVKVMVIPTNEELVIAQDTLEIVSKMKK